MISLDDISIGKKLMGGFLIVIILLLVVSAVGYISIKNVNDGMSSMYLENTLPIEELGKADSYLYQIRGDMNKVYIFPENRSEIHETIQKEIKAVNNEIAKYRAINLTEEEKVNLSEFDKSWGEYQKNLETIFDYLESNNVNGVRLMIQDGGVASNNRKATSEALNNLISLNSHQADEMSAQGDSLFRTSLTLTIILSLISIIIALGTGYVLKRNFTERFNQLLLGMSEVGKGNLSYRIRMAGSDEITTVATTFDEMSVKLEEMDTDIKDNLRRSQQTNVDIMEVADEAGRGNLKKRIDISGYEGEFLKLVTMVNDLLDTIVTPLNEAIRLAGSYAKGDYTDRMSEKIIFNGDFIQFKEALDKIGIQSSELIGSIKIEVENLTAGMEETSASSEEVASSTGMLSESSSSVSSLADRSGNGIRQILIAMDDLSSTVSSVASKAENVSALAQQTVELSEKGANLAGKAEIGMDSIIHSFDDTGVIVTDITSQMEEIGKIVEVITAISEQTSLLALNAAIEAARAGDAGKGFAVVADEVKSLAFESQKSAENIATIIEALQKKSNQVTDSMNASAKEIHTGNAAVTETLTVFTDIVEAINHVHSSMTEVAAATEEQAASVEEITASVHEVESLVQDTAKEAVDSAAATEEVAASIEQITKAITDAATSVQRISNEMVHFKVN